MDLAIGHSRLHQLLTRGRDDGDALWDNLQLALRLALTLDHHCQTRIPSLKWCMEFQLSKQIKSQNVTRKTRRIPRHETLDEVYKILGKPK